MMIEEIVDILKKTKEKDRLMETSENQKFILSELGLVSEQGDWLLGREARLELAMMAISKGAEFEKVIDCLTWKDFEVFVAGVLRANDYRCIESFRRRGNDTMKGMEIDVIGVRRDIIISIDAKMWDVRKGKTSALKNAAEKQIERTRRLCEETERMAEKIGDIESGEYRMLPVIVTWFMEDIDFYEGVPIVPIFKLNNYILELESYWDCIVSLRCIV